MAKPTPRLGAERLRVGILFGGRSAEHEVSVVSAQGVMGAIDADRFQPVPLGVSKGGAWLTPEETQAALKAINAEHTGAIEEPKERDIGPPVLAALQGVDVVFPLIHGTYGEDGSLQGLLEILGIPYVGAGVTASAVGMDKALQQMIFRQMELPVPHSLTVTERQWKKEARAIAHRIEGELGYPCFVKPVNSGSSIGTSKARSREDLTESFAEAFRFDRRVLAEEAIEGRQVECSVLGYEEPEASPLGEITFVREFYDYVAKYDDPNTRLLIPADLPSELAEELRAMAIAVFRAIDCAGMARVDFFLNQEGKPYVNEINTIPGFTPMSMYAKLWETAGLSYSDQITRLIELALERHRDRERRA